MNVEILNFPKFWIFKWKFLNFERIFSIPRILTELRSEKFVWFGPSPIEPFNSGDDRHSPTTRRDFGGLRRRQRSGATLCTFSPPSEGVLLLKKKQHSSQASCLGSQLNSSCAVQFSAASVYEQCAAAFWDEAAVHCRQPWPTPLIRASFPDLGSLAQDFSNNFLGESEFGLGACSRSRPRI